MDYDSNLVDMCPATYVEQARQTDLSKFNMDFVISRAMVEWRDAGPKCREALAAYFSTRIGPDTEINNLRSWLSAIAAYKGEMPSDLQADVRAAFLRILIRPDLAVGYFSALREQRIDIRDELARLIETDPAFRALGSGSGWDAWNYTIYLASLNTPMAYQTLEEMTAAKHDSGDVYSALSDLSSDLGTPQARQIAEKYADDQRILYGPNKRGEPLGKVVQVILKTWGM